MLNCLPGVKCGPYVNAEAVKWNSIVFESGLIAAGRLSSPSSQRTQNYDIYVSSSAINTHRHANDARFSVKRDQYSTGVSEGTRSPAADICEAVNSVWPVAVSEHIRLRFTGG